MITKLDASAPGGKSTRSQLLTLAITSGVFFGAGNILRADTEMEWDAQKGYHEEEWYDPSDWFNEDGQTSYETDDDRRIPAVSTEYYTPYYYYWDPAIVGWTTEVPDRQRSQTVSDTGNDAEDANGIAESDDSDRNQRSNMQRRNANFSGTIDGFRKMNLQTRGGQREEHSFVRLRLEDGRSRIVSIGSNVELSDLKLSQGEEIDVTGHIARVDDRQVLIAKRIETEDRTFNLKPRNQPETDPANRAQRQPANQQQVTVQGRIADKEKASIQGIPEENLVVEVELRDGKTCYVDLGKGTSLSDINLGEGDRIQLQGKRKTMDGKTVIVAEKLRVEDKRTRQTNTWEQRGKDDYAAGESRQRQNMSRQRDQAEDAE